MCLCVSKKNHSMRSKNHINSLLLAKTKNDLFFSFIKFVILSVQKALIFKHFYTLYTTYYTLRSHAFKHSRPRL